MTAQPVPAVSPSAARGVGLFFAPLQRELDRVLADFSGFDLADVFSPSPRLDLRETDTEVEMTVELPGLTADDIKVELQDDLLTVSGEKKSTTESDDAGLRIVERRYGRFSRSVRLPAGVRGDAVKASLDQGVLTVTAPRDAASRVKPVAIPVKSA